MTSEFHYFWLRFCSLFVSLHNRYPFFLLLLSFFSPVWLCVPRYILCYAYLLTMVYQYHWDFDFIDFYQVWKKCWNYFWKYFSLHLPRLCPLFLGHQLHIIWKLLVLSHSWLRFSICLSYGFFFFLCISTWIVSIPMSLN